MNPSRLWFERLPWALFKTLGRSSLAAHGLGVIPNLNEHHTAFNEMKR